MGKGKPAPRTACSCLEVIMESKITFSDKAIEIEARITMLEHKIEKLEYHYIQMTRRQVQINEQLMAVNKHIEVSVAKKEYK